MFSSFNFGVSGTVAVLLGGAMLAACSSSKNTGSSPILEADLPAQYAQAICGGIQGCCGKVSYPYDSAACLATESAVATHGLTKERPTDAVYDPVAAGNCVAKLREIASSCSDPADFGRGLEDACTPVFAGKKQLGEACGKGGGCAPRSDGRVVCASFSSSTASSDGGTGHVVSGSQCTLYKPPSTGDPCGFRSGGTLPPSIQGDCQDVPGGAFYCERLSSTCQPRVAVGQPCSGDSSACVAGSACNAGVCTVPAVGMDCTMFSADCGRDLYCAVTGSTGRRSHSSRL